MIRDPELIRQWTDNGYALLKQAIPHAVIDQLNADVAAFRRTCGETKDDHGFGQRIGLFHSQNATSLQVALSPEVRDFLRFAFADEPLLYGSLTFETGTEQAAHQDSIFFFTDPEYAMAGVWLALEDVHPDSGPLFYYPGTHKWGVARAEQVWAARPDLHDRVKAVSWRRGDADARIALANELGAAWHVLLHARIAKEGLQPVPVLIKKGDALVWHAHLVHGGLPRNNRALSRRSMVTHHIGRKAMMFDMYTFFLRRQEDFGRSTALGLAVAQHPLGPYVQHEKPVTY
jgi:ectoine hydroxylase-related dioxygenase (phytanoyl-CoA dioxygenase family)